MRSLTKILLCSVVFLCLVEACAALTYEKLEADRSVTALRPNDTVTVTGILKLPPSGDQTFALDDIIEFYTQLDSAKWTTAIVVNGRENPQPGAGGKRTTISGMDLAYVATKYEVKVSFSMTGSVPSTFTSGDIILVRALELDSDSDIVGAAVYKNGTVFNPDVLKDQVARARADLASLKSAITEKASMGVVVTAAQQKYDAAKSTLDSAESKIQTSPSDVSALLKTVSDGITAGNSLLDKAWAQQSLDAAKTNLSSVDGLINEFTVNRSIKVTDSRLVAIINKRDLSAQAISNANDLFTTGTYSTARAKANDGNILATQAWNLSLTLKGELDQGFSLPNLGAILPFLVVVVVVLIIAGVIIYRKKTQWDELG